MNARTNKKIRKIMRREARKLQDAFFLGLAKMQIWERIKIAWTVVMLKSAFLRLVFWLCVLLILLIHAEVIRGAIDALRL